MADSVKSSEGGAATPPRPPVVTPTDEWLARISDQLTDISNALTRSTKAAEPKRPAKKTTAAKRAEVRGD